jgi:hypothetical protein
MLQRHTSVPPQNSKGSACTGEKVFLEMVKRAPRLALVNKTSKSLQLVMSSRSKGDSEGAKGKAHCTS